MNISYTPNHQKIIEALLWFVQKSKRTDMHSLVKKLFYSDKIHLEKYARPVTGDTYVKMENGPVGSAAYDFLKVDRLSPTFRRNYPADVIESACSSFKVSGTETKALRDPDLDYFSRTDLDCMQEALSRCDDKDFGELVEITHKELAWKNAIDNSTMQFQDFIGCDHPDRDNYLKIIAENSECLAL